jgi:hypothetical protein
MSRIESKVLRHIHMSQSVTGPLKNWNKRDWNSMAKCWTREDGTHPTGDELKEFFIEKLGEGWKVLPVGKCDNFDKEKGCRGHESN